MKSLQWIAVLVVSFYSLLPNPAAEAAAPSACALTGNNQTRCCTSDLTPTWWCASPRLSKQAGTCSVKIGTSSVMGDLYTCAPIGAGTGTYSSQITTLAGASSCASYAWKSRGKAPSGYIKGMALTFARSLCRTHEPALAGPATIMEEANTGVDSKDALAHYAGTFKTLSLPVSHDGIDTLRALYTLGIGLAMRESSGNYCEGWDTSAGSKRSSSEGEAGLFQTSYNSMTASPELSKLYSAYQANPSWCMLDSFKVGASCSPQSVLGTGAGATYQEFNKSCPAFAAEYAMVMLRILRAHYGPINRLEAEVRPACDDMLQSVQDLVEQIPSSVCEELF